MGKNSKSQNAEMRRQYMNQQRLAEAERQKKQNRLVLQILIPVVCAILILVSIAIILAVKEEEKANTPTDTTAVTTAAQNADTAPKAESIDFSSVDPAKCTNTEEETDYVRMNISYTDKDGVLRTGDVIVRLYADVAPVTVQNFKSLVKSDFYDGLTFHRVYPGFMIQGGDPNGDGSGNSTQIKGEMTNNGWVNNLEHKRGVLSMARSSTGYNTGSCQFFIIHEDSPHLDGEYASFGFVVSGMETVDAITEIERKSTSGSIDSVATSPVHPVTINYVTFVNVAVDQ